MSSSSYEIMYLAMPCIMYSLGTGQPVEAAPDLKLCSEGTCRSGEFFDSSTSECSPCPPDTYMDMAGHNCSSCRPCTPVDPLDLETLVAPCTRQTDTVLGCPPGHYMVSSRVDFFKDFSCHLCSSCGEGEQVMQECGEFDNVKCSSGVNPIVIVIAVVGSIIILLLMVLKLKGAVSLAGKVRRTFQFKEFKERPDISDV